MLQVMLSRFCLYLFIFITLITHAHIEAHTHTEHTCMVSTQEECRQPGTGARARLVGRCGRKGFVRDKDLAQKEQVLCVNNSKHSRFFVMLASVFMCV